MTEIFHYFGEDFRLDAEGNLLEADQAMATRQSILRRLCTNPPAYLWHSDYGAGLPARIGMPVAELALQGMITAQLALETGINHDREVAVDLSTSSPGSYRCIIAYTALSSETVQSLAIQQDGMI
ncbi:phage tail protein [Asaia krungthepensis]|uniref:Phage tail protein n=1 Tax=Asaia krungthepensis NRIC 0535 TaxID=1307925 RepID=A0ABQ0Q2K5_9PROT|nr:phage tail protein [Asaia krungthepensis]GBQ88275.1 phage tail protein [Asaia krungthepensis NRIC 0535]